jgi:hypothetical protein
MPLLTFDRVRDNAAANHMMSLVLRAEHNVLPWNIGGIRDIFNFNRQMCH